MAKKKKRTIPILGTPTSPRNWLLSQYTPEYETSSLTLPQCCFQLKTSPKNLRHLVLRFLNFAPMLVDAEDPWMTLVCPLGKIKIFATRIAHHAYVPRHHALLSSEEQERAARLVGKAQKNFILTRVWLRSLLGQLLHTPASLIQLHTDPQGKPLLPCGSLQINWSHSRDACVLAVSHTARVGIDIEFHRERFSLDMAQRYFHPQEYTFLKGLPESEAQSAFYRCWSRKEAHYKCVGGHFIGGSLATDLRSHHVQGVYLWDFQGPYPTEPHSLGLAATL